MPVYKRVENTQSFVKQRNYCVSLLRKSKRNYYSNLIVKDARNSGKRLRLFFPIKQNLLFLPPQQRTGKSLKIKITLLTSLPITLQMLHLRFEFQNLATSIHSVREYLVLP